MTLIGLSIIVASLSIFCYKHPPSSWSFLTWFRREALRTRKTSSNAPTIRVVEEVKDEDIQKDESKADLDRKAMPPPPPPLRNSTPIKVSSPPASPDTPKASAANSPSRVPTFTLDENKPSSPPSFPARNSIQRASGGQGFNQRSSVPVLQPPLRSANLMAPPPRGPLPNRGPPIPISSSLALPPTHSAIPTKPSKKVQLLPGHSPLDWAYLSSRPDANLRGLPPSTPYLRVPPSLLRQYTGRKGRDAWTVLGGKVYNITPYLPYHPGGEPELLKAAGKDGTKLFGEVHPWVNWEGMLEPCLVGIAVSHEEVKVQSPLDDMD